MALTVQDFEHEYLIRGGIINHLNVARSDEAASSPRYYLYLSEEGAYFIQRIVDTAGVKVYTYFGQRGTKAGASVSLSTNWSGRAGLPYVEFNELF